MVLRFKDLFKKQTNSITNQVRLDARKKEFKKLGICVDDILNEPVKLNKLKRFDEVF
jgi:hypothetical protein